MMIVAIASSVLYGYYATFRVDVEYGCNGETFSPVDNKIETWTGEDGIVRYETLTAEELADCRYSAYIKGLSSKTIWNQSHYFPKTQIILFDKIGFYIELYFVVLSLSHFFIEYKDPQTLKMV